MSSGILKCPRITEPEASRHQTGADPGFFFRRGCTPLLLYFNTNKPHFFFCRIPVVLENRRSSRGGGGVRTPCTLLLDPPLPKQQELLSPVKRWLITLLPIFLDALHILMFSHVHSLGITTRHMFFFLININPGASNLAELVKWSPDTTQKQRH